MDCPLVSVIIPAYNAERFISQALDSVLRQTYEPVEIIVVDDGSTDKTNEILTRYADRIEIVKQSNRGLPAARNAGIAVSEGTWLAFLDADDMWVPRKIELQLKNADENAAVLHCGARVIDNNNTVVQKRMIKHSVPSHLSLSRLIPVNTVLVLTAMVKRDAFFAVDGFDAENRIAAEDWQLWLKLACAGYEFDYLDQALTSYRLHSENMSSKHERIVAGQIYALEKTAGQYPEIFNNGQLKTYHNKLHYLYFDLAYRAYDQCRYDKSARMFQKALICKPTRTKAWLYAAAHLLPFRKTLLPPLRRTYQRITQTRSKP